MARFGAVKTNKLSPAAVLFLLLLLGMLALFLYGTHILDSTQSEQQLELLTSSVNRSVTQCYALEGSYPANLDYLTEHYGLTYDSDRYYIDYQFIGSNLRPDITIIKR